MKLISSAVFACSLLIAQSIVEAAHARGCPRAGRFNLTSPGPWPMRLRAWENDTCGANFRSHGPMIFRRLYLVAPPKHATIRLIEGGRYRYTTRAGYRGPDSFTLRVCGNQGGYEGCADLQYAVTIE